MIKIIAKIKKNLTELLSLQLIKFGWVGVLNTVLGYAIFFVCIYIFKLHYSLALIIEYIFGISNSYIWNKLWTFKSKNRANKEIFKFIIVYIISLVFNYAILFLLIDILNIKAAISQIIALIIIFPITFIGHKRWTFKNRGLR